MKKEIFAVYFPSWHPDSHYEKWYGKGFCEWELMKTTRPLFEGHHQPRKPSWGWFDESDPQWMARQIDLAADHGITGFMFDWYWYQGEQFLEKPLNETFLHSPNRNRLKFFLMWANHSWGVWPALADDSHRGMNGSANQSAKKLLLCMHTEEDLKQAVSFCCDTYFHCENYWMIEGRPVFSFFNCNKLFDDIGAENARRIIRETAVKNGFEDLYMMMNIGCCNDNDYFCGWGRIPALRQAGYEAAFAYNSGIPGHVFRDLPDERPLFEFDEMMVAQQYCWDRIAEGGLPWMPSITLGGDVSPRWNRNVHFPMDFKGLGYCPICIGNTPEKFQVLLKKALKFDAPAILINAWNEWSEGMALLPDNWNQDGFLRKIAETVQP